MARHDGVKAVIGGTEYTIPPLNLKALKRLAEKEHLQKLTSLTGGVMDKGQLEAVVETIAIALQRNYPDLTSEWVEENVEVSDIGVILAAVLRASGFKEKSGPNAESP